MDNKKDYTYTDTLIKEHTHNGVDATSVDFDDIFGYSEVFNVQSATIATTGNTDAYFLAPRTLSVVQIDFSGVEALSASDTNYITWTITNLGQDGSGSAALLAATDPNTTKATGGTALVAGTKRTLTLSTTLTNLQIIEGDRIRIRAAATGTLASTITFPVYLIILK
jgi:hypothetical protein